MAVTIIWLMVEHRIMLHLTKMHHVFLGHTTLAFDKFFFFFFEGGETRAESHGIDAQKSENEGWFGLQLAMRVHESLGSNEEVLGLMGVPPGILSKKDRTPKTRPRPRPLLEYALGAEPARWIPGTPGSRLLHFVVDLSELLWRAHR